VQGDGAAGNAGYLQALEQAGALTRWQPPADCVGELERGPVRPDGTQWAYVQVQWSDPPSGSPPS
jgi:hypothetical protein